jgi:hypothetical protein
VDEFLMSLCRDGALIPQSPDEDLASRLVVQARRFAATAARLPAASVEETAALRYVALFGLVRAWLSAKGYRLTAKDPHLTVARVVERDLPGEPARLHEELRRFWTVLVEEPDMPSATPPAARQARGTDLVLRGYRRLFEKEFPAFRALFRPSRKSPRTVSAERSFR